MASSSVIVQQMWERDFFSQWLGIRILEQGPGIAVLEMKVRNEMCNGFGIAHGGISYSLADSALAFASNGHGRQALSIQTSISLIHPVYPGEILRAETREVSVSNRIGIYEIKISNQDGTTVAVFQGTVYRKSKTWD